MQRCDFFEFRPNRWYLHCVYIHSADDQSFYIYCNLSVISLSEGISLFAVIPFEINMIILLNNFIKLLFTDNHNKKVCFTVKQT